MPAVRLDVSAVAGGYGHQPAGGSIVQLCVNGGGSVSVLEGVLAVRVGKVLFGADFDAGRSGARLWDELLVSIVPPRYFGDGVCALAMANPGS